MLLFKFKSRVLLVSALILVGVSPPGGDCKGVRVGSGRLSAVEASRYSTSQGDNSGSGLSAAGGFGGKPSQFFNGGTGLYRAASGTMSRLYTPGLVPSNTLRPSARIPAAAARTQPTKVIYSTSYIHQHKQKGLANKTHGLHGIYLGTFAGSFITHHSNGEDSTAATYVPLSDRYTASTATQTRDLEQPNQHIDLCTLARWNRELPFADIPNMALQFLQNDAISGSTIADKSKFMYDFLKKTADVYSNYNSSADVFAMPKRVKSVSRCLFPLSQSFEATVPPTGAEEPLLTALRYMIGQYSYTSKEGKLNLQDVVDAVKVCLPKTNAPIGDGEMIRILPCMDFSLKPQQLLKLHRPHSIFGNQEVCRLHLDKDIFKCLPSDVDKWTCKLEHLVALNLFARNFYICPSQLELQTMSKVQDKILQIFCDANNEVELEICGDDLASAGFQLSASEKYLALVAFGLATRGYTYF
ncbi:hypothetical protein BV898_11901 [Hypsibius exemplaris]|uniref:Uncharacterized protein n=1 Tax=Hypsibius exemplaris TaxID=2072580 RepID=A0A1W0WFB4_HYPEX|nr:hypothetical protein BV898_11901 [Hypsibius exemplaris]